MSSHPPLANRPTDQPINSDTASSSQPSPPVGSGSCGPTSPPAHESSRFARLPLWTFLLLPVVWHYSHRLLLTHDPLSRALQLGADLAKEQALKAIPQDWMGWLAQPVIQLINEYVTPYAITGKALMASWALTLGVIIPAAVTLLAFVGIHLVLRITGGAPGGWRATARSVGMCLGASDLAVLAWTWWQVALGDDFLSRALGLGVGLVAIRLIALSWLLIDITERHRLGVLRILLLGIPTLILSLAFSALFAFAWWLWFTAAFALDILR